ncbi:hypothetical protein A3850_008325 [Lewinella sp. 4G2]|nr:hypothetical protein A3850_008325 [Lewinella sp. 4G2]
MLLLWLMMLAPVTGQVLPPASSYSPDVYGAGTQNWAISQDDQGFVYVANNQGLLQYDGERWTLQPSPNGSIVRSVKSIADRVYVGSYMDFGYYPQPGTRDSAYVSLADRVRDKLRADEQFWKIEQVDDLILFQSLNKLYLYDPAAETVKIVWMPKGLTKLFSTEDAVYFQTGDQELFRLENEGEPTLLTTGGNPYVLVNIWDQNGVLYGQTANDGTVKLVNGIWEATSDFPFLRGKRLYSSINLRNGGKAFGAISSGLYVTNKQGELIHHVDRVSGLANNTVLSLFEDEVGDLWAGTDNGISIVNLRSPIRKYTDVTGQIGTVHATAEHEGMLYLGTNQGLYAQSLNGVGEPQLVTGTRAQVWSLFKYEGTLFCGHDRGTFVIDGLDATLIDPSTGTWSIQEVPGRPELLLQGTYNGLSVLRRVADGWAFSHRVEGFEYSARFLAVTEALEVYISHEYRGVYGLRLNEAATRITEQQLYEQPGKYPNAGLIKYEGKIYHYSGLGVYQLLDYERGFERDKRLSELLNAEEYASGTMVREGRRLWFFTKTGLTYLSPAALGRENKVERIALDRQLLGAKLGYENLIGTQDDRIILGIADGYLSLDLDALRDNRHEVFLRGASAVSSKGDRRPLQLDQAGKLAHFEHNLELLFAVPDYSKYLGPQYRYRVLGLNGDDWTEWQTEARAELNEIPPGTYTVEGQSCIGEQVSDNRVTLSISVVRPWYASRLAWTLYLLVTGLMLYLVYRYNRRYYHRKQEALRQDNERLIKEQQRESELALSRLQNDRLREDVESKSREMASTMLSLVKKNELLQEIKEQLEKKAAPEQNISRVVETINHNLNEAETWSVFRAAFENADREFFKNIKERHPALTPSDLKLCAYLRLNLSTKEIASMLNISPRSAEVKRYRLRKKMDLERETGLADYIMSL